MSAPPPATSIGEEKDDDGEKYDDGVKEGCRDSHFESLQSPAPVAYIGNEVCLSIEYHATPKVQVDDHDILKVPVDDHDTLKVRVDVNDIPKVQVDDHDTLKVQVDGHDKPSIKAT